MKVLLLIQIVCLCQLTFGQNPRKIEGHIEGVSNGVIYLSSVLNDSGYYNGNIVFDSIEVEGGAFKKVFSFNDTNTYAYRLIVKTKEKTDVSGFFFVTNLEKQYVRITTINGYVSPEVTASSEHDEITEKFNPFFKEIIEDAKRLSFLEDSIYNRYGNNIPIRERENLKALSERIMILGDSMLFEYCIANPKSKVALWKLAERFQNFGSKVIYKRALKELSKEFHKDQTYIYFDSLLNKTFSFEIGNKLPDLILTDVSGQKIELTASNANAEFILIDFWFSTCKPCIQQFESYKEIYRSFYRQGLKIIGVAIQDSASKDHWEKTIRSLDLPWYNLLDTKLILSKEYGISSFPSNILVTNAGIIVGKNISEISLKQFLKTQLAENIKFQNVNEQRLPQ